MNVSIVTATVMCCMILVMSDQIYMPQESQESWIKEPEMILNRVKRRGGHGSYGTRVSMPVPSSGGKQIDPIQLALGAKVLVLKALIIKQLLSTTTQMPVITNVNSTVTAAAAGGGGGANGRLRTAPGSGIRRDKSRKMSLVPM